MQFHYIATDLEGKIREGDFEAAKPSDVLVWMTQKGYRPVSIKSVGGSVTEKLNSFFQGRINTTDKVFLTKYLSLMLKVGTDLFSAIDILIKDFDKPVLKALLIEVKETLGKGQPFYTTFERYPKTFSPVFVNLLKAGEVSGNLEKVFADLSTSLEKEEDLKNKVQGALIYPLILLTLASILLFFMVAFAIPKIADVFSSNGMKPPLFSQIVFTVGLFLNHNLIVIIPGMIIAGIGGYLFFGRTLIGRNFISRMVRATPVVKTVIHHMALQRFASVFGSLLTAGMPFLDSLEITAETADSDELRTALYRISRDGIAKGVSIGDSFRREQYFPHVLVNLIAISEKAGHIETILKTLAEFYEREIDSSVKIMVSFLEPVMLLFIGAMVGLLALAVIIPIYQLVGQVNA